LWFAGDAPRDVPESEHRVSEFETRVDAVRELRVLSRKVKTGDGIFGYLVHA